MVCLHWLDENGAAVSCCCFACSVHFIFWNFSFLVILPLFQFAIWYVPFYHFAIFPFYHFLILQFCHFNIFPFPHLSIFPFSHIVIFHFPIFPRKASSPKSKCPFKFETPENKKQSSTVGRCKRTISYPTRP